MMWAAVVICTIGVVAGSPMSTEYDVIVVGMGPAGTMAAASLAQAGKQVLALEAQNRVGGRVCTVPFGDGIVELGAEWIHGTENSKVYDQALQNNVPVMTQDLAFKKKYNNGPGLPSLTLKLNTEVVQVKWPKQTTGPVEVTTKDGATYRAQSVIITVSVGVLKERHPTLFSPPLPAYKHRAVEFVSFGVVDKVTFRFPSQPCNSSACLFIWKTADKMALPETDRWLVSEGMSVPMACPTCGTFWLNGDNAKHSTLFSPPLPQEKLRAVEVISIGVVDKIEMRFAEAFWPKHPSFYGFIWKTEDRKSVASEDEWTTQIFGSSSPLSHDKVLTIWTSGDGAKLVETLPDDVVKSKVMGVIRKFMGANVPEPLEMIRSSWYSNPFTRGSYSYDNILTPHYPAARVDLSQPLLDAAGVPRVLFAGEATNPTHFSTVHGAMETGYREAAKLLQTQSKL